jgi:rare lipoprotein A
MRRIVLPVACFCGLWTAANAQSVQRPSESGFATWYGAPYHGQRSASGEIYDQEKLTAAHRTLPFGTRVRVHRLDGGGSVVVRINDRGPFVKSRVIDLSHAAAVQLGMTGGGVVPVILDVVWTPPINPRSANFSRLRAAHCSAALAAEPGTSRSGNSSFALLSRR